MDKYRPMVQKDPKKSEKLIHKFFTIYTARIREILLERWMKLQRQLSRMSLIVDRLKVPKRFECFMPNRNRVLLAFGQNVRKRREAKDWTQEALAEKAELDRTYISDVERGARNVSLHSIARIAKALGMTISELSRGIEK